MKRVLRCMRCGAVYPEAHGAKWGHSGRSDGYGRLPQCTELVDNPAAARAMDPETKQHTIVAQEVCGGQLSGEMVADATEELEIEEYGKEAVRGPLGVKRQRPQPQG